MFFVISKLGAFLLSPLTWIIFLLIGACFRKARRFKLLLAAVFLFYFFSNGFILSEFLRPWEIKAVPMASIRETYDVGILMGGLANYDLTNDRVNFNYNSDRMWQALQLYHTGRIKKLLITSGSGSLEQDFREAQFLKDYLISINFPAEDIITDTISRNTYENAVYTAEILKEQFPNGKYLVITSAYHLRRTIACFKKQGIEVVPYSTNRMAGPRKFMFDHVFLPNSSALQNWDIIIHEWIGMATYKIMGYC